MMYRKCKGAVKASAKYDDDDDDDNNDDDNVAESTAKGMRSRRYSGGSPSR